jgi:lipopolysaccharide export system permease protein
MILFVLTFVLLMGKIVQLMDLMVNKGVSFFDISKLIIFLMPSFLIFTIPISLLISILIGLGRLSGDNEITIFKVSGISLYQLAQPIIFASVIAFLITAVVSFFLVPQGNYATKHLLFDIIRQKPVLVSRKRSLMTISREFLSMPIKSRFMGSTWKVSSSMTTGRSRNPAPYSHKRLISFPILKP